MPIKTKLLDITLLETEPPKRPKRVIWPTVLFFSVLLFSLLSLLFLLPDGGEERGTQTGEENPEDLPSWIQVQYIDIDGASRRGEKLEGVTAIAIHYVGNPGTSAQNNRNYFNQPESTTSAHFVVGLEGEVIQCVPLDEKSSATNHRNRDTISVEVCHPDESGKFSEETMASLVHLLSWLCDKFSLDKNDLIRHYDVTGKLCPLYYVENEDAWQDLKDRVEEKMNQREG